MKGNRSDDFYHPVPTIIKEDNRKYLIFSSTDVIDSGLIASTYFYNLEEARIVAKISGAEVFVDYFTHPDEKEGSIFFLSNSKLLARIFDHKN